MLLQMFARGMFPRRNGSGFDDFRRVAGSTQNLGNDLIS